MFERLNTPEEIFTFKLGSALTMEQKLVEVLGELEEHANRDQEKRAWREHRQERVSTPPTSSKPSSCSAKKSMTRPARSSRRWPRKPRRQSRRPTTRSWTPGPSHTS